MMPVFGITVTGEEGSGSAAAGLGSEAVATATGEEGSGSAAADLGREAVAMAMEEEGSGSACHVAHVHPKAQAKIQQKSHEN